MSGTKHDVFVVAMFVIFCGDCKIHEWLILLLLKGLSVDHWLNFFLIEQP